MSNKVIPITEKKDFDWYDVAEIAEKQCQEEIETNPRVENFSKIASLAIELYSKNPKVFITEFNRLVRQVKLNTKIKETFKTKDSRKRVYAAISFFDKMVKKQSYDEAYEIASKHYRIPESYLRSIVGTRNNLKRSGLKT